MSYASGTTHYNLPQTVGSDKRDWTDTNQAFSDIDAAIYGAAQGASAATSAIETINGQIETITGKQAVDEGNISTMSGKVSTLESTIGTQGAAIADVRQDLQDNIESKREASATSTHAYEVGDTFYYNDVLYKATAQIDIGGTIVPSTNCTAVTVMSELARVEAEIPSDDGYVEVTGNGVKTTAQLLNELYALVDRSKVSAHTDFTYESTSGTQEGQLCSITAADLQFAITLPSSTGVVIDEYVINASNSTKVRTQILTNGTTVTDNGSEVMPNGSIFRITY